MLLHVMNKLKRSSLFILVSISTIVHAGNMFTLSGITKVYPVVEISGAKTPKAYKQKVYDELATITEELGIDTKGYDPRSLAVLVNEMYVGKQIVINLKLVVGEEVKRLDSNERTFAFTYADSEHFIYKNDEELEETFEDSLDTLLSKFVDQYSEENKKVETLDINEAEFAKAMGYETNYKAAVAKAQKEHKNIMLVLVANYCPWCRKFEQRVLLKKEVNAIVQKNYIPLIINKEKEPFPKKFDKSFTPIVHFIEYKTLESYTSVVGYNNRDEFLYVLRTDKYL